MNFVCRRSEAIEDNIFISISIVLLMTVFIDGQVFYFLNFNFSFLDEIINCHIRHNTFSTMKVSNFQLN